MYRLRKTPLQSRRVVWREHCTKPAKSRADISNPILFLHRHYKLENKAHNKCHQHESSKSPSRLTIEGFSSMLSAKTSAQLPKPHSALTHPGRLTPEEAQRTEPSRKRTTSIKRGSAAPFLSPRACLLCPRHANQMNIRRGPTRSSNNDVQS
jgi:hypothetical protein